MIRRPKGPYRDWVIWAERGVGTTQAVVEEVASWALSGQVRNVLFVCAGPEDIRRAIDRVIALDGSVIVTQRPLWAVSFGTGMRVVLVLPEHLEYQLRGLRFEAAVIEDFDLLKAPSRTEASVNLLLSLDVMPKRIFTFKLAPGWPVKRLHGDGVVLTTGLRSMEPVADGKVSPDIEALLHREEIVPGCRFTARRKIYLIQALDRSDEAAQAVLKARFGLADIELAEWRDRLNREGQVGLKATSVRDPDHRLT